MCRKSSISDETLLLEFNMSLSDCFTIDTGPGQCIKCANSQFGPLTACGSSEQWNQSCLIDPSSLGASHCGSAAIKYPDFSDETIKTDVIRGCFNCSGK